MKCTPRKIIDTATKTRHGHRCRWQQRWRHFSHVGIRQPNEKHKIDILKVSDWNADDYHESVSHSVAHVRYVFIFKCGDKERRKEETHSHCTASQIIHDHCRNIRFRSEQNDCVIATQIHDLKWFRFGWWWHIVAQPPALSPSPLFMSIVLCATLFPHAANFGMPAAGIIHIRRQLNDSRRIKSVEKTPQT